jgi:hypothetical protein
MHEPIPEEGKWLRAVVGGHFRYYGVPLNQPALAMFRFRVGWYWHRSLSRRSQNGHVLWDRMRRLITLAAFALCLSSLSFATHGRYHLRQEPDAGNRPSGSVEGVTSNRDPYSDYDCLDFR